MYCLGQPQLRGINWSQSYISRVLADNKSTTASFFRTVTPDQSPGSTVLQIQGLCVKCLSYLYHVLRLQQNIVVVLKSKFKVRNEAVT
jgi:hypothetical protein